MREILSTQNPQIKLWRKLKTSKGRLEQGLFIAEGKKLSFEAIMHARARALLVVAQSEGELAELLELANSRGVEAIVVSRAVMEVICDTKTPQDALVIASVPEQTPPRYTKTVVALENIADPGNVGAIIRTADAAGVDTVVLTCGCAAAYSPKVIRASMGSIFHINIHTSGEFYEELIAMKASGYSIIAGSLGGGAEFPGGKCCILVGNEGSGLTQQAISECTHSYKIPMPGNAESLNVAVAASIMIYKANGII